MIKTFKEYKIYSVQKAIDKNKAFAFNKVDERYYYIYRITNTLLNKHYYGSRVSKIHPKCDIGVKYFSSSNDKSFIQDQKDYPMNYKYKIIRIFDNTKDKEIYESYLHQYFGVKLHNSFYNKSNQTPFGHDTTGIKLPHSEEVKNKISKSILGMVNCYNINNNWSGQVTKEEFDSRVELVHHNSNMVICFDASDKTNTKIKVSKEEFDNNINLISINKNRVRSDEHNRKISISLRNKKRTSNFKNKVKEITTNTVNCYNSITKKKYRVTKEEFDTSDHLYSATSKLYEIFSPDGKLKYSTIGNFLDICRKHNLPSDKFIKSYRLNIHINSTDIYNGWYSKKSNI